MNFVPARLAQWIAGAPRDDIPVPQTTFQANFAGGAATAAVTEVRSTPEAEAAAAGDPDRTARVRDHERLRIERPVDVGVSEHLAPRAQPRVVGVLAHRWVSRWAAIRALTSAMVAGSVSAAA